MAVKSCSIEGCEAPIRSVGLCRAHYRYKLVYGDGPPPRHMAKKGEGSIDEYGYHKIAGVRVHRTVAEKALGKPLPPTAVVHHVNSVKSDNRPENLVICPDENYHRLLHARERAYDACGNADWRKCLRCKMWAPSEEMVDRDGWRHRECERAYMAAWKIANREKRRAQR